MLLSWWFSLEIMWQMLTMIFHWIVIYVFYKGNFSGFVNDLRIAIYHKQYVNKKGKHN